MKEERDRDQRLKEQCVGGRARARVCVCSQSVCCFFYPGRADGRTNGWVGGSVGAALPLSHMSSQNTHNERNQERRHRGPAGMGEPRGRGRVSRRIWVGGGSC